MNFEDFLETRTDVLSRLRRSSLTDQEIMTVGPLKFELKVPKAPVLPLFIFAVAMISFAVLIMMNFYMYVTKYRLLTK